jgi:L-ectoine synthase
LHPTKVGDISVLNKHDRHVLRGGKTEDMILVSVFDPPLIGTEKHTLANPSAPAY